MWSADNPGTPNPDGWSVYFVVEDVDDLHDFQRARGADIVRPPDDRPYGLRDYQVRDLHGHRLTFGAHLHAAGAPIEIERVDVHVRLERRLVALLADLAAYKRTDLTGLLEETLLHTLDGVGPHTARTLERIGELRAAHGIDYDAHASYRFVEK